MSPTNKILGGHFYPSLVAETSTKESFVEHESNKNSPTRHLLSAN